MGGFQDPLLLYISLGMFCTWFVQMYSLRFQQMNRVDRMVTSFVCSILTPAVALPLLDLFPQLPNSMLLIIGAVVGTIGFSGWSRLATAILSVLIKYVGEKDPSLDAPPRESENKDKLK